MFEVLVAFGAPGTVSQKNLLATLASLGEDALVVGYDARTGKAPATRWFTLMGGAEESAEAIVAALVAELGSLSIVVAYDTSGLVAVTHHERREGGIETTLEVVEDGASQARILHRELPKLHGKRAVEELQAAVAQWTYVNTVDGEPVSDVDALEWAIDVGEAADIAFHDDEVDDDDDEDDEDDEDDDDDDAHVIIETDDERDRRKAPIAALFGDPDRIEDAIAASAACRAQGDFTWYNAEHYALESRSRWSELTNLHRDRITFARTLDRYGTEMGDRVARGSNALNDAVSILRGGDKAAATALVALVHEHVPKLRSRYEALFDATVGRPAPAKRAAPASKPKPKSGAKPKPATKPKPKYGAKPKPATKPKPAAKRKPATKPKPAAKPKGRARR